MLLIISDVKLPYVMSFHITPEGRVSQGLQFIANDAPEFVFYLQIIFSGKN